MISGQTKPCCSYIVDHKDQLVAVDRGWSVFAHENNGAAVVPERVLRTSLWDHVVGLENRIVYKRVLDRVRRDHASIHFALRCDGPSCERHMQLSVEPLQEGDCLFTTFLVRSRKRSRLDLFDPRAPRTDQTLAICDWCMRINAMDGRWQEVEQALRAIGSELGGRMPKLFHTICPDCLEDVDQALSPRTGFRSIPSRGD